MGLMLIWAGARQKVEALLGRLMEVGADVMAHSLRARGFMSLAKGCSSYFFEACPWQTVRMIEQGRQDFIAVGSERSAIAMQTLLGLSLAAMGERLRSVEMLREALAAARRTEQGLLTEGAAWDLCLVLADSAEQVDRQEAIAGALELLERGCAQVHIAGMTHAVLARETAAGGALREAELHARKACELLVPFLSGMVFARTVLSGILLAQGRVAEAREVAQLGVAELERMRNEGVFAVGMYLALAQACFAQGETSAGDAALNKALRCVRARASDIPEPGARERFLRQVPENARTLELARERWGELAA
jgi:eukaryotic-like serine/threonine-protein kinase